MSICCQASFWLMNTVIVSFFVSVCECPSGFSVRGTLHSTLSTLLTSLIWNERKCEHTDTVLVVVESPKEDIQCRHWIKNNWFVRWWTRAKPGPQRSRTLLCNAKDYCMQVLWVFDVNFLPSAFSFEKNKPNSRSNCFETKITWATSRVFKNPAGPESLCHVTCCLFIGGRWFLLR